MMSDALPSKSISFLTTDCPKKAKTKYSAVLKIKENEF